MKTEQNTYKQERKKFRFEKEKQKVNRIDMVIDKICPFKFYMHIDYNCEFRSNGVTSSSWSYYNGFYQIHSRKNIQKSFNVAE